MSAFSSLDKTRLTEIQNRIRGGFYFQYEIFKIIADKVFKELNIKK
ncbi:hypothetical protein IH879_02060 [candidate division KSB1 bacterium]|nr:hypothetical protein [candidate division KSB1 bacterium]MCH7755471.1 hypothetical protein [candidate division KSB1 bacterium]